MARKRRGSGDEGTASDDEAGEHRSSLEIGTALIPGENFAAKAVTYAVVDGFALFEGDIVLGTVEEVEQRTQELRDLLSGELSASVAISGGQFRWPNCTVPYTIDAALTNQQRVTDAIAHWESRTQFRFVLRTAANAGTFNDYVTFRPGGGCSAMVGRRGGQQFVNLGPGCSLGNVIHEIGHVIGLWHEQSREDRDQWVTIRWDKITAGMEHNFNQHITDGDDIGPYDYGSIMHYPRNAFSVDGSDTITPVVAGAQIGQRNGLSAGDIAAVNSFCAAPKPVKELAKDSIKDVRKDPFTDTRKEVVKDVRLDTRKELIRDTLKEQVKEPVKDRKERKEPVFDLPKVPFERPRPGGGVLGPGPRVGGLPFVVATPHQAPAAGQQAASDLEQGIAEADAHLEGLAEQLAQVEADRAALQAQYDELAALLEQQLDEHDAAGR